MAHFRIGDYTYICSYFILRGDNKRKDQFGHVGQMDGPKKNPVRLGGEDMRADDLISVNIRFSSKGCGGERGEFRTPPLRGGFRTTFLDLYGTRQFCGSWIIPGENDLYN